MRSIGQAGTRILLLLLAVAALAVVLPTQPASATPSPRSLEQDFLAAVNVERAKAGLGALVERTDIRSVARSHSQVMAQETRLHHNPNFSSQITGWQRVSENVGFGPSVESIHRALMNSEGHRRNILDDRVTEAGIGVVIKDGRVWVTQNFRRPTGEVSHAAPSSKSFGDVRAGSTHADSIERIAAKGIADPCSSSRFCPTNAVTRGSFATMLVRALDLPRPTDGASRFTDTNGEVARDAEALAAAGLTTGCREDSFCPDRRLTREQLATFFARALELEPRSSSFSDVSRTHDGNVGALQAAGIVNGCTSSRYCPTDDVTRAQTASMLDRNLR